MATRSSRWARFPRAFRASAANQPTMSTQMTIQRRRWPAAMLIGQGYRRYTRHAATRAPHTKAWRGAVQYGGLAVYTGNAHPAFARDICRTLEMPLGPIDVFKFANDNIFVKINDNVREHDVYIVQSLTVGAGVGVSDAIMELLIMIDAFKRASAARITAVMPYYAYGRSDKKDQPRVPITARLLADLITVAGADRFLTMDMHQMQIQGFFGIPGDELSARNELVNYLRTIVEKDKDNFALVVPDLGYANQARRIGELLDVPLVFMQKTHRDNSGRSEIVGVIGDIDRRRAIIIDDEIDRGTTVLNTVRVLQERGVSEIWVACTHPVLSGDAAEKLLAR